METLREKLQSQFKEEYSEYGLLPFLKFKASGEECNKFLLVGSEHGDKPYGTKAMLNTAKRLKKSPLKNITIDMIPVLDTEGYPSKRTIVEEFGLGNSLYMDAGYELEHKPHQIKALLALMDEVKYNFAFLLGSSNKDEAPIINGFYMVPQLKVEEQNLGFLYPYSKDLVGAVVHALKGKGIPVLNKKPEDVYLGAGHMLFSEGFVIQGIPTEDKKSIKEFKTTGGFLKSAAVRGVPALALYALSSHKEREYQPTKALQAALESIINVYEKVKRK